MTRLCSGWNMPPGCYRVPGDEPDPPDWYVHKRGMVKRGRKCTSVNCPMRGRIPAGFAFEQWVSREGTHVVFTQFCTGHDDGPPCSVKYKPCPENCYDYSWGYGLDQSGKKDEQGYPASCSTCGGKGYVERESNDPS